jgi:hypothetical protein
MLSETNFPDMTRIRMSNLIEVCPLHLTLRHWYRIHRGFDMALREQLSLRYRKMRVIF